ncbi:MAG: hypothetical protein A2X49_00680 [Lentisphaerae bacterium GWF2_52_8]|nr:MAG: hypothetical protein A2X49_00680 [Lentisphaerae bacterium GWF2_52_8]
MEEALKKKKLTERTGVRQRFPELESLGLATEYFPCYVNEKPHLHGTDVILLSFIIRGEALHWMEGEQYREAGVSLGVTHYGERHTIVTGPEGIGIMNIYLNPENRALPTLPPPLSRVLPELLPLHPCFKNQLNRIVRISFERPDEALQLVMKMHCELKEKHPGYRDAALACFKLFLIECCRSILSCGLRHADTDTNQNSEARGRLEFLRGYLDTNYQKQLRLEQLAKKTGLQKNYLCRVFKNYTGKSIFDYLLERRLQSAMISLRERGDKIASIAFENGFQDLSFFNRKFREIVGQTPSQYRRRQRNFPDFRG